LVNAFDQVVEPLITEITCLRSHELRLFHLVSAFIGSPLGELRPNRPRASRVSRSVLAPDQGVAQPVLLRDLRDGTLYGLTRRPASALDGDVGRHRCGVSM
jgi:hypothetical protein